MAVTLISQESPTRINQFINASEPCTIEEFCREEEAEVLDFLGERPLHTVFIAGLIRDNGLVSPDNRGSFYACRSRGGDLEGVGLVGHATVLETRTERALLAFAHVARNCQAHVIRGEQQTIERFWDHYAHNGQAPRLVCRELLFEQCEVPVIQDRIADLRLATIGDLDKVMAVNASMAFQESGISPLKTDPAGFRQRTARRIEQGRIWVWIEDNRLVFKADIVADTPQVIYLEGVHVHEEERRKGYGLRCLTQLSSTLLESAQSICLTINERNKKAICFYEKAGYQFHSNYETIYLP